MAKMQPSAAQIIRSSRGVIACYFAGTLLRAGEWCPIAEWTDPEGLFALLLASSPSCSALLQR
jgi:hypothetical protein